MSKKPFLLELTPMQEKAFMEHVKSSEEDEEKYYSLTEAAKKIGCSKATLYLHRQDGLIKTVKIGRMDKITQTEINRYLNK